MQKDERVTDEMVEAAQEAYSTFGQMGHLRASAPSAAVMRAALTAALSSAEEKAVESEPVAVKALEWITEFHRCYASAPYNGCYIITEYAGMAEPFSLDVRGVPGLKRYFATLEDAKAAAQADYEQRIRSAIAPAPAGEDVEELRGLLDEAEEYVIDAITSAKEQVAMNEPYPTRAVRADAHLAELRDLHSRIRAALSRKGSDAETVGGGMATEGSATEAHLPGDAPVIKVGAQCRWLVTPSPLIAMVTHIEMDDDGDPWFHLTFECDHKDVRVERSEIAPLETEGS